MAVWPVGTALSRSAIAYPLVNAAHILALAMVVGAISALDLRVLGLYRTTALDDLARPLSGLAAVGVAAALITGFLLFSVRPTLYAGNPAFLIKVGLVALGILNALGLRANPHWRRALAGAPIHASVKLTAAASLLIWAGAVIAGRWIAFTE